MADPLIDPTTGHQIWSGPAGEGGSASRDAVAQFAQQKGIDPGAIQANTMPDGRVAYYIPGQFIQNGNRQAMGLPTSDGYTSLAPGANSAAAGIVAAPKGDPSGAAAAAGLLLQSGLNDLMPYVDQIARGSLTWAELEAQLYDSGSAPGKVVDKMYPELRLLRDAGKPPQSIAEIQALRSQYAQVLKSHDAPPGFYDQPEDFTQYIVGQKSPDELNGDLAEWRMVADDAAAHPDNASIIANLGRWGITPDSGAFLAYVADPTRGLDSIKKMVAAGGDAAAAQRAGFGDLSQTEAERLAAGGITTDQAAQGFGDLVHSQQLTQTLPGEAGSGISRADQLGAEFGGDANARAAIERVRGQRQAEFQGGGRTATGQNGSTGLTPI